VGNGEGDIRGGKKDFYEQLLLVENEIESGFDKSFQKM